MTSPLLTSFLSVVPLGTVMTVTTVCPLSGATGPTTVQQSRQCTAFRTRAQTSSPFMTPSLPTFTHSFSFLFSKGDSQNRTAHSLPGCSTAVDRHLTMTKATLTSTAL